MSDFDWGSIAGPLIRAGATTLGTVIGGPGGAAIGAAVGPILADALGVPATPEAVAGAAEKTPDAVRAVEVDRAIELRAAIEKAQTEQIKIVNETMLAEMKSEDWITRLWRPAFGFCFCLVWTVHGLAIGHALFLRQYDVIARIPDLTVFYGVAGAVVGVYAWRRSDEKLAGVAGGVQSIGEAIKRVVKGVKK
jgi:hypothetical protein